MNRITFNATELPHPVAHAMTWRNPALRVSLAGKPEGLYFRAMAQFFDRTDRARLRERFHGATCTVLARL